MITTDLLGSCGEAGDYSDFGGTSAAAPLVAGVVALIREANPRLTYRDVKLILAESAKKNRNSGFYGYKESGKMYSDNTKTQSYSNLYGFGLVDAKAAVDLARNWTNLPPMKTTTAQQNSPVALHLDSQNYSSAVTVNNSDMRFIESVQVDIKWRSSDPSKEYVYVQRAVLSLTSPDGKEAFFYHKNESGDVFVVNHNDTMRLIANGFLGNDQINGTWRLNILQQPIVTDDGVPYHYFNSIESVNLTIRGH